MEDFNDTAAGCVVISCCCPCLLLQITLFVFLRLPRRLVAKSKKMMMTRKTKSKKSPDVQDTKKTNKEVIELPSYLQAEWKGDQ
ncbi:hypothetical protein HPP92_003100 [Vanilla planifolia]|uniref:Uncharacterized protein n=1 Tax=Vanilla planifolia TaxID=51239 RepID=A0A835RUJ6_VANPL|nr:hypothetical protein HPP92_003100 [Vanilla planifolia]